MGDCEPDRERNLFGGAGFLPSEGGRQRMEVKGSEELERAIQGKGRTHEGLPTSQEKKENKS